MQKSVQQQSAAPQRGAGPAAARAGRGAILFWVAAGTLLLVVVMAHWQSLTRGSGDWQLAVERELESALVEQLVVVLDGNFRRHLLPEQLPAVAADLDQWWQQDGQALQAAHREQLQQVVEARMQAAFDEVRARVDVLADWHYAPRTNYRLLWEMARETLGEGDLDAYISEVLQATLFESVDWAGRVESDQRVIADFQQQQLLALMDGLSTRGSAALSQRSTQLSGTAQAEMALQPALFDWKALEAEARAYGVNQLRAATAAPAAALLMSRLGQSAALRAVVRRAWQGLLARMPARAASGAAAAGGALSCGPAAPLCATALFGLTWAGADLAVSRIDEWYNRDAFVAELKQTLDRLQQDSVQQAMAEHMQQFEQAANAQYEQLQAALSGADAGERSGTGTVVPGRRL